MNKDDTIELNYRNERIHSKYQAKPPIEEEEEIEEEQPAIQNLDQLDKQIADLPDNFQDVKQYIDVIAECIDLTFKNFKNSPNELEEILQYIQRLLYIAREGRDKLDEYESEQLESYEYLFEIQERFGEKFNQIWEFLHPNSETDSQEIQNNI